MAFEQMYECTSCQSFWTQGDFEDGEAFAYHGDDIGQCPKCGDDCHPVDEEDYPTVDDFVEALHRILTFKEVELQNATRKAATRLLERVGVKLS